MTTITISLPELLKSFVDSQLAAKGFGNVSEYFRSLLRTAQQEENEARIEKLLLEGLDSGEPIPITPTFWKDMRAEAARRLKERKSKKNHEVFQKPGGTSRYMEPMELVHRSRPPPISQTSFSPR